MISALTFFSTLVWIDGKPLQIEEYRKDLFSRALDERRPDGKPSYNMVVLRPRQEEFQIGGPRPRGLVRLDVPRSRKAATR